MNAAKGAEEKLLELGEKAIARVGVRGMKVRRLCEEAGVSPGTFTSFFGTKAVFTERVLTRWYAGLAAAVQPHRSQGGTPMGRLRAGLLSMAHYVRTHAGMIMQLIQDAGSGQDIGNVLPRLAQKQHMKWLAESVREAQAAGEIVDEPVADLLVFLLGSMNLPYAMSTFIAPAAAAKLAQTDTATGDNDLPLGLLRCAIDAATMEQRLDWALRGIATKTDNRTTRQQ